MTSWCYDIIDFVTFHLAIEQMQFPLTRSMLLSVFSAERKGFFPNMIYCIWVTVHHRIFNCMLLEVILKVESYKTFLKSSMTY